MKLVRIISKILLGLVFTFSGFVKCVDPLGTAYKIEDYLINFGMDGLLDIALVISIIMCGLELLIGLMLLFSIKVNWGAFLALIFMIFYTPLTLYVAIFNPVTDCGCFGDALVISNWGTFIKNIFLLAFAILVYIQRKNFNELFNPFIRYVALFFLVFLVFGFEIWSLNRLPVIDFRPYKIGVNIQESMEIPPDAPNQEIESTFIYQRGDEKREFTINNLPDSNEGWEFVDRIDKVITEGYEPPIHNFNINTLNGWDITSEVLDGNYVGLMIAYDLNKTSEKNMRQMVMLADFIETTGHRFICLTSSSEGTIEQFKMRNQTNFEYCVTDPITLKTIIRSNPGLMLIKHGTILNKWHHRHLPTIQELDRDIQVIEF